MHILIYGVGAVGGMLGTRLALAGADVTFLTRPAYRSQFADGLTVIVNGKPASLPEPALVTRLEDVSHPVDAILLCIKMYDLEAAIDEMQAGNTGAVLVSFINGVESEGVLARAFGTETIIPATLTSAVSRKEAHTFIVSRERGVGIAGDHPLVPALLQAFQTAGFYTRSYSSGDQMKWSKLLSNITANATAAILGWTAGDVFAHDGTYRLELAALREAVAVMAAMDLRVAPLPRLPLHLLQPALCLPGALLRPLLTRMVAGGRGGKPPSFSFDIGKGRSEVAWLNGAVARIGTEHGVDAPVNRALTAILLELVEGRASESLQDQPERLLARIAAAGAASII